MDVTELQAAYRRVRCATEGLCEPLQAEDYVVQSMTEASPVKWHLAHTSWFFETFILRPHSPGYRVLDEQYEFLFNSYYNAVGPQFSRSHRGLLTRPTVANVFAYREHVDEHMLTLLETTQATAETDIGRLVTLGLHHEQQHQELILTDLKHLLGQNPLHPVYRETPSGAGSATRPESGDDFRSGAVPALTWQEQAGGLSEVGHAAGGFAFDNEKPRHQVFVAPFTMASRLITCGEYLEFMSAGGYQEPEFWLSEGWDAVRRNGWRAPLYWEEHDSEWHLFTLNGSRRIRAEEPVCHVSYFEADAFARWARVRLPTEQEWEVAAKPLARDGNFVENLNWHPVPLDAAHPDQSVATGDERPPSHSGQLRQMFGDVWEWTASPYTSYPGYRTPPGALGEYNAKFMCNQLVLRGGSCATPRDHIRSTYRNFFHPQARWQFAGIRLAKES